MIIIHDFGSPDGDPQPARYDVFVAALEDGTYSVAWNLDTGFSLTMSEATLKAKSLEAQRQIVLLSNATYSKDEQFDWTEEDLGLISDIEA